MALTIIHNCELSHHFCNSCAEILAHARGVKACQDNVLAPLTRTPKSKVSKSKVSMNKTAQLGTLGSKHYS